MQILRLIEIHGFIEGGSSKPLLITAVGDDHIAKRYVMKLFKSDWVEQNFSIAKEIFMSQLADDFALSTPKFALIDVEDKHLLKFFSPQEVEQFDKGYKFCSEFMEQYTPVINKLLSLSFIKQYDIENLFCFDNLVFNVDRGGFRNKPNLLINDDEILLIDHEQTLPFINNSNEKINYFSYVMHYQYQLHVATQYIKSLRNKNNLFDEFFESLRYLNIEKYHVLFNRMDELEIKYGNRDNIFAYLNWAKSNVNFLSTHLISLIR